MDDDAIINELGGKYQGLRSADMRQEKRMVADLEELRDTLVKVKDLILIM